MTDETTPWCCPPPHFTSTCPLCPEYGTRMITHCPSHPIDEDDNRSAVETAALHARFAHPDYEYATTEGPRKAWDDANVPPYDDDGDPDYSWESNDDAGRPGMGWDRFDYTEESYWRRRKPKSAPADGDRRTACPCGHDADHHDAKSGCIECRCRPAALPDVVGRCPACGGQSLFLADGGYVTCSRVDCPQPDAAHEAIEERAGANAYDRAINAPMSEAAAAELRRRLADGTAPRRKVRRRDLEKPAVAPPDLRAALAAAVQGVIRNGAYWLPADGQAAIVAAAHDAVEQAIDAERRAALPFVDRIGNAREWARRNLTVDQQHALFRVLRGDTPTLDRPEPRNA